MTEKAIEKINNEMQKDPTDRFAEILGHYIIDRSENARDAEKVLKDGKSLKGAMDAVTEKARKARHGNVAVLTPEEVFGAVDDYFGFKKDGTAQGRQTGEKAPAGIALSLEDFL